MIHDIAIFYMTFWSISPIAMAAGHIASFAAGCLASRIYSGSSDH